MAHLFVAEKLGGVPSVAHSGRGLSTTVVLTWWMMVGVGAVGSVIVAGSGVEGRSWCQGSRVWGSHCSVKGQALAVCI